MRYVLIFEADYFISVSRYVTPVFLPSESIELNLVFLDPHIQFI